jgi:5-methylthioadenosine/S-adenosylhomocysteine deaminase
MHFDLLIVNGTVITVDPQMTVIDDGVVGIKDGLIKYVALRQDPPPAANKVIDAAGGIIMPGLVNAHTHTPMTLFRGLADDLPLDVWLNEHMFPAEATHVTAENVRKGTFLACAEMLLGGTTCCCDGYFFETEVARVFDQIGMRAVLGQGVIDFPAPGVPDPADKIKNAVKFVTDWQDASKRLRPSIFCHAPYTCSADTLKKAKSAADELGVLFQIHAAETKPESQMIPEAKGASPIAYLNELGILNPRTLLVHCVWADSADIDIIAKSGAAVAHCPESNLKLAAGIAPLPDFLNTGINIGLGTDGCASNNDLDLLAEMDSAAKLHKGVSLDPTVVDAATILKMATIKGARTIGLSDTIGSLETDKAADIIILDTNKPHLTPMYNPISHVVYTASAADVRDVIVGGETLIRNRVPLKFDLEKIMTDVNAVARDIKPES